MQHLTIPWEPSSGLMKPSLASRGLTAVSIYMALCRPTPRSISLHPSLSIKPILPLYHSLTMKNLLYPLIFTALALATPAPKAVFFVDNVSLAHQFPTPQTILTRPQVRQPSKRQPACPRSLRNRRHSRRRAILQRLQLLRPLHHSRHPQSP